MPLLARKTNRLLRRVDGMPYATDADHDEPAPQTKASARAKQKMETEEDIHAEPASSDDDLRVPMSRPSLPKPPPLRPSPDRELRQPERKSGRKRAGFRTPTIGAYEKGIEDKAKENIEHDKENAASTQISIGTANIYGFDDEFRMPPAKKQKSTETKTTYGTDKKLVAVTRNIHVPPPKTTAARPLRVTSEAKKMTYSRRGQDILQDDDDSDDSDVSMKSLSDRLEKVREERSAQVEIPKKVPKEAADPELRTKTSTKRTVKVKSLEHATAHDNDEQPNSSAPREVLENIDEYHRQLGTEEEEGTQCGLCKVSIEQDDYWAFWGSRQKTMKNVTAFCLFHKKNSAQKEYDDEGFPPINWPALPDRILKHRMPLFQILNNTRHSRHRDAYAPLALTGKAAAVPSRRSDLAPSIQNTLQTYNINDQSTYPGYYGPRGRRIITEQVTDLFANEIKNCKDAVVQASGFAAFVQAVLVPETAALLIMEDVSVDRETAEEMRERTVEMGVLLNEEDEDVVEGDGLESEDENEYHGA